MRRTIDSTNLLGCYRVLIGMKELCVDFKKAHCVNRIVSQCMHTASAVKKYGIKLGCTSLFLGLLTACGSEDISDTQSSLEAISSETIPPKANSSEASSSEVSSVESASSEGAGSLPITRDSSSSEGMSSSLLSSIAAVASTSHSISSKRSSSANMSFSSRVSVQSSSSVASSEPSMPKVLSLSLINAETDQVVPGFDPLLPGAMINFNAIGTKQLTVRANTNDVTDGVVFVVNNRFSFQENRRPFALAGDDGNGDFQAWGFSSGEQDIIVRPYARQGQQIVEGELLSVTFSFVEPVLEVSRTAINFDGVIGQSKAIDQVLSVRNTGNALGAFSVQGVPDWLAIDITAGDVKAGEQSNITLTSTLCTQELERKGELTITSGDVIVATVVVEQHCLPFTDVTYDLALERVYFMQSTTQQDSSQDQPSRIPLVANRKAIVRAFVTENESADKPLPRLVMVYQQADGSQGEIDLSPPATIDTAVDESRLNDTYVGEIPENLLQEDTIVHFVLDPDDQVPESNPRNNRYPQDGSWNLDIKKLPDFNITFIPIAINGELPTVTEAIARDLLQASLALHPIARYTIDIRAPYTHTANDWSSLVREVSNLRRQDGSANFYHGLVPKDPENGFTAGIGFINGKSAVSLLMGDTIAHELGHNFGRPHAPCGVNGEVDGEYPYAQGAIGVWGFDSRNGTLKAPSLSDYMGYCRRRWTSDYNYRKILNALDNNLVRSFKASLNTNDDAWFIEGVVNSEELTVNAWQKADKQFEPNRPGDYWVRLLNADGDVLGRAQFGLESLDHSTIKPFFAVVNNDFPHEQVASIEVGINQDVLYSNTLPQGGLLLKPQLSIAEQIIARRIDDNRVEVIWPANGQQLMIKNASGKIIAQDATGNVVIFTQDQALQGVIQAVGADKAFAIDVELPY